MNYVVLEYLVQIQCKSFVPRTVSSQFSTHHVVVFRRKQNRPNSFQADIYGMVQK
jgi:hypothetical protein